jgi:hypothetical protein
MRKPPYFRSYDPLKKSIVGFPHLEDIATRSRRLVKTLNLEELYRASMDARDLVNFLRPHVERDSRKLGFPQNDARLLSIGLAVFRHHTEKTTFSHQTLLASLALSYIGEALMLIDRSARSIPVSKIERFSKLSVLAESAARSAEQSLLHREMNDSKLQIRRFENHRRLVSQSRSEVAKKSHLTSNQVKEAARAFYERNYSLFKTKKKVAEAFLEMRRRQGRATVDLDTVTRWFGKLEKELGKGPRKLAK